MTVHSQTTMIRQQTNRLATASSTTAQIHDSLVEIRRSLKRIEQAWSVNPSSTVVSSAVIFPPPPFPPTIAPHLFLPQPEIAPGVGSLLPQDDRTTSFTSHNTSGIASKPPVTEQFPNSSTETCQPVSGNEKQPLQDVKPPLFPYLTPFLAPLIATPDFQIVKPHTITTVQSFQSPHSLLIDLSIENLNPADLVADRECGQILVPIVEADPNDTASPTDSVPKMGLLSIPVLEEVRLLPSALDTHSKQNTLLDRHRHNGSTNFHRWRRRSHSICTNPASAARCGMKIVSVGTDAQGSINMEDWRRATGANKDNLSALMVTYSSTHEICGSFGRLKEFESAYETLQHMVALAFKEGTSLKRTPEGKFCCPRLDIHIPSDNDMKRYNMNSIEHLATSIFDEEMNTQASVALQHAGFDAECKESRTFGINMLKGNKSMFINKVLPWSFNDVIHACAQTQNSWLAEQLILQMQTLGLEPSCHTYDGLIRAIISEKGFGDGMKVLRIMEKGNLKPYESTVATLSIGDSRGFDLNLAEDLLDQISGSPCAYPYNVFLEACDTMDQPERAVRMLAKMIKLKVKMDIKTYELLFSLFGNVNAPYEEGNMLSQVDAAKRINAIEMDMLRNGIQHSQLSIKNLLRALGSEGMIRELIQYLRIAENQFAHNTFLEADIYNTVLHSLVEAKESHMAIEIFRNMKLCGFWPDAATYNIMIDCCSNIRSFKSACALVSMMVRDGFYPQTLTYTSLIKILLECDDFDEALNLLDQAISEGNQPDVLLFNTILNKAYLQGRIDVIELTIERMHEEKIQPDSSTCNYVFSAYADRELFSTAVEALQVLSMRMISENDSALEEKRMEFEEFILAEDPEAELRIMQTFSHSENLAAALFNLRWCSMIGFSVSWPPNHSLWVRRLVRAYGTQNRVA